MPASSKKSPLTTTKKKKATPVPGKNKRNGVAKKDKGKDSVNNKDGSYLNDESQSMLASVGSPPHTIATTSSSVDHTVLSVLTMMFCKVRAFCIERNRADIIQEICQWENLR